MDHKEGCVRGRTLRLGKATLLFAGAHGMIGFAGVEWHPIHGARLRLTERVGRHGPGETDDHQCRACRVAGGSWSEVVNLEFLRIGEGVFFVWE